MLESLFNKVSRLQACKFFKKRPRERCFFPVSLVKFLRTPILENIYKLLLLHIKYYNAFIQTAIRFSQQNTKFYSCTQTAICFFKAKYEILQLYPNISSFFFFFLQRNTKFYSCTQTTIRFFTAKYEILQLYPNGHSFFYSEIRNLELYPNGHSFFYYEIRDF